MPDIQKTKNNTSAIDHQVQSSGNAHSSVSYTQSRIRPHVDTNLNLSGDTEIVELEEVTRGNLVGGLANTESGDDADESDYNLSEHSSCDQMEIDTDSDGSPNGRGHLLQLRR